MLNQKSKNHTLLLSGIMALSLIMHWHVLDLDLVGAHVWRQTNTQTVINNFVDEDLNILNPRVNAPAHTDRIFRMEFPIMQWVFALFYKIFGDHIIISRILTLLISFGSIAAIFHICKKLFNNNTTALIAAWALCFSPLFYYYSVNPLPDNLSLCAALWSLYYYLRYSETNKTKAISISGLFLLLATLSKLPYVVFGAVAIAHFIQRVKINPKSAYAPAVVYLLLVIPAIAWYVSVIPTWGDNGVLKGITESTTYRSYDIIAILSGTLTSTLPEMLLNYGSVLFFVTGIYFLFRNKSYRHKYFNSLLAILIAVLLYYFYEVNMISLVHDYYLLPFLPLLFIAVAYGATQLVKSNYRSLRILAVASLLSLPVLAAIRINGRWHSSNPGFNVVLYDHKDEIRSLIPENAYCIVGNDVSPYVMLYYIDRKGWVYRHNNLTSEDVKFYISKGARFLLTDGTIDNNPSIIAHLKEKVFEEKNLRIYSLN